MRQLEFPKVLEQVARHTETAMGAVRVARLLPYRSFDELAEAVAAVRESVSFLDAGGVSLSGAVPVEDLARLAAKGAVLSGSQLWGVAATLTVADRLRRAVQSESHPVLSASLNAWSVPTEVWTALLHALDEEGNVRDRASSALFAIRRKIRELEQEIDQVLERIIHSAKWAEYLQEPVITLRFGRRVVPVKASFRHNVEGLVHDQSGSGQTVFVEPMAVVARQNRLTGLRSEEAEEVERILADLSGRVGSVEEELSALERGLGWCDRNFAAARHGRTIGGALLRVGSDRWRLLSARHPLLENPVPITVELDSDRRILIVTGPNTGGKTVALKTMGLMAAMSHAGLMVPAADGSELPFFSRFWVDIGDEQSIEQSLSTFSGHLRRLVPMVRRADAQSLCLIDEIGAGTDPEEGLALAEAMIERMVERRTWAVITTHLGRLKLLAYERPGIENGRVTFDRETLSPTYHLVMGQPGTSEALYIAERYGMDPKILETARERLGAGHFSVESTLSEMNAIEARLREREARLTETEREREAKGLELQRERERFEAWREHERGRLERDWKAALERFSQAFESELSRMRQAEGKERAQAVEAWRESFRQAERWPGGRGRPAASAATVDRPLMAGDFVTAPGLSDSARVVAVEGTTATIEAGALRLKLAAGDLTRVDPPRREEARSVRHSAMERRRTMSPECDLRGMTVEEALEAMDRYLDDAVLSGLSSVRIIHGKGTGALRRAVGEALAGDPRVARHRLGQAGEGGDGVTVADFEA